MRLTIAWYSWERHIEVHGQFFSPAPVDNYRGVDANSPIVHKLHDCERQYDCGRDQRHCSSKVHVSIIVSPPPGTYAQNAPVRVLTLTSSIVYIGHEHFEDDASLFEWRA